jgi:23S rRNA (uracil1939-C5)-methyltransferase
VNPITVTIHDIARGGSGVARLESGEVVFVPFTAPGDVVSINITEKTKSYSHGEIVEILQPSKDRIEPLCPSFTKCGGCSWQHLPYTLQFETKKKGVLQALKRAGVKTDGIEIDDMPAKTGYFYRNRIQLRGNPVDQSLGFYEKNSTKTYSIDDCKIARKEINDVLPQIRKEATKLSQPYKVEVEVSEDGTARWSWDKKNASFGFRQVNDEQNIHLQNWVKANIGSADLLLDLYGGAGNLSKPLVSQFKEIHCVDTNVPAEKSIDLPETFNFYRASVVWWLQNAPQNKDFSSAAILDPPREGLGADFAQIEFGLSQKFSPDTIILVGCDADSFARDSFRFTQKGYTLTRMGVLDLFPQTPHVESLAVFKKSAVK